jgi:hypothetical protein
MRFVLRDVSHVTFLEPGLQTPLPKTLTFRDEGKIRELARRGEAWQTSEDRQLLDYAIAKGEGGVYLRLSPEQYARLRRPDYPTAPAQVVERLLNRLEKRVEALQSPCVRATLSKLSSVGRLRIRAVQISELTWFGVQIIRGLCAVGGLRENRVGLGWLP